VEFPQQHEPVPGSDATKKTGDEIETQSSRRDECKREKGEFFLCETINLNPG